MARIGLLLWVALLAFALPEVFAGTGAGWLTRPDVYVLALPLYALHFILLCHLAVKTRRTGWTSLYLLGIVFGLYETWVTKVVWSGYPNESGFAMGGFGPWFGVHETIGLLLFYHAVTSFLLPIAVLSRLFPSFGAAFPIPDWIFGKGRWAFGRRLGLALIWGLISGHNMPDVGIYLASWLPMLLLLVLGYLWLRPAAKADPTLGRWSLWLSVIWLAAIYIISYKYLRVEEIPPDPALAITAGFYLVLGLLYWLQPRRETETHTALESPGNMPLRWLLVVFLIGLMTSAAISAGVGLAMEFAAVPFLMMLVLGVGLFVWLVLWRGLIRRPNSVV